MRIPQSSLRRPLQKHWSFSDSFTTLLLVFVALISLNEIHAEGSKDFVNAPGYRLFLDTRDTQQMKVYANVGEFINIGSSHLGIAGGFINVYRPDGTLAVMLNGSNGNEGIIFNNVQEVAGPTGGGSTNGAGYVPAALQVQPGEAGVWTVYFGYPTYSAMDFPNVLNSAPWTRAIHQPNTPRVILAWDITISKQHAGNEGGQQIVGRVFTNEFVSVINQNGYTTSPSFHVLTKDGFIFKVDFSDADPFRFPISSNNCGFVRHNLQPIYKSQPRSMVVKSDDPGTWVPGSYYFFEPQSEDHGNGLIINNKIFFNSPNSDLPANAQVTDIFRNNTHDTWLNLNPFFAVLDINNFELSANGILCPTGTIESGSGGYFSFTTNLSGIAELNIDINNDGDFEDDVDVVLYQQANIGDNQIPWDGLDGLGNELPKDVSITVGVMMQMRGGESHVLLTDVENNVGGVSFSLENGSNGNNADQFYFDHSTIGGPASGGGAAGNPQPTSSPFGYQNNFGNNKILDYWAFYLHDGQFDGTVTFMVTDNCNSNPGPDRDGDGIPDAIDIDDDNDGITDKSEFCNPVTGFDCLPGGLDPSKDADNDGIPNLEDADDVNFSNPCVDADADGICDMVASIYDTDGDGIADLYDLDSDNDGIPDLIEAGHGQPDVDRNGVIDGPPSDFGANGLYNAIASDPDDFDATEIYPRFDEDQDGVPDHDDLDSDNDGIHDVAEAGFSTFDTNNDGRIDDGAGNMPVTGATGLVPIIDPVITGLPIPDLPDHDSDGVPDWHDRDSDNDLINDVEEGGNIDPDNDAMIGDGIVAVDQNGLAVGPSLGTTSKPMDSDGDLVPDYHDLDTDNDGVNDVKEAGGNDPDDDGWPEIGIPVVNGRGMPTSVGGVLVTTTSLPMDTDLDLVADYRDLDSDNDVINDIVEHNFLDHDNDGRIGSGNPLVNVFGQALAQMPTSTPTDTDNDGIPDMQELDSDDDGILDVREADEADPDFDGIIGTGTPTVDADGRSIDYLTTSKPTDSDGDGIPDFQEVDSDNDGLLDSEECMEPYDCADGDNDSIPDFQDPDRDNDGIFDGYECETGFPCPDTDNDGIPDLDDLDTDNDTISDTDECPTGDPCPDANGNGIPEWREVPCNPNIVIPVPENVTSNGNSFCYGSTLQLNGENSVDVAGDSVVYQWSGPNGFSFVKMTAEFGPFPATIPNLTPDHVGDYSLHLFTEEGCVGDPASVSIDLDLTPDNPVLLTGDDQICLGENLALSTTAYAGANVIYHWYFDDGTNPEIIASTNQPFYSVNGITIDQEGSYSVQVEVDDCMSLLSDDVVVEVINIVAQTPGLEVENDVLCEGGMIELNSSIVQGVNVTYEWWFNNGTGYISLGTTDVPTFFMPDANITHTGIYNVSVHMGGCESQKSNSEDVTVSDILVGVQPFLNASNNQLCGGDDLFLSTSTIAGNNVQYHWWLDNGNGAVSIGITSIPNLTITNAGASASGNYSVSVSSGNCNSVPSNTQTVSVNSDLYNVFPQLDIEEDILCEGETIYLSSEPIPGSNLQYEWWLQNSIGVNLIGISIDPEFYITDATTANSGNYFVIVTNGNCKTVASNLVNVLVSDGVNSQTPALSVLLDQPCEGESIELNSSILIGNNINYNWWFDQGNGPVLLGITDIPTYFIQNASPANSGVYTVSASFGNCESPSSNAQDIEVTASLSSQSPVLSASQNLICVGETLTLNSSVVTGNNVTYEWWFNNGAGFVSLGTSDVPTFFVGSVSDSQSGLYQVTFSVGNCTSQYSNTQSIEVTDNLDSETPQLSTNLNSFCQGETLELNSSIINGGNVTYEWFFNDGSGTQSLGVTNIPTLFINDLTFNNNGVYTVQVSVGNCTTQPSNAQQVVVTDMLNNTPTLSVESDVVCEGEVLQLNSTNLAGNNVSYNWWFDNGDSIVQIATTDHPTLFIQNTGILDQGIYMVSANIGGCSSQLSNALDVAVQMSPNLALLNTTDFENLACEGDVIELSAPLILGASYQWIGPNGFTSNQINPIIDNVTSKNAGNYSLILETEEGCEFLSDATQVFVFVELDLEDDSYQLAAGDSIVTSDLLANDDLGNISNWIISVVSAPILGNVVVGDQNELVYKPVAGQSGNDLFIYQICNPDCPDQCEEAVVNIRVYKEEEEKGACFIPNIITPNDDGANDALVIPCLETDFSNNNLKIFNRWGDQVFEAQPYKNNWKGTYKNTQLPPGTYFYVLQLDTADDHCLQGYFTLTR